MPEALLSTAGGKITCLRCNAMSKRTRLQCGAPAMRNKQKCATHGGKSTGPRTVEGRQRCAQAKTIHGVESRQERMKARAQLTHLRFLASLVGVSFYSARIG